jgi:hypothetical protein
LVRLTRMYPPFHERFIIPESMVANIRLERI